METPRSSLDSKPKSPKNETEKVNSKEKVTIKRKRDIFGDIADALTTEQDGTPRGDYLIDRVILPAARKTVLDVVKNILNGILGAVEVALYGSNSPQSSIGNPRYSYTDYTGVSGERSSIYSSPFRPSGIRRYGSAIIVETQTKEKAQNTITYLRDLISASGSASLAQLCEELGEVASYTDTDYGWKDIGPIAIVPSPNGWSINLPRPIYLNRLGNLY